MVYSVYRDGKLLGHLVADNAQDALQYAARAFGSGGLQVVRERDIDFESMSKDDIAEWLNLNLKVSVNWSRLSRIELVSLASAVNSLLMKGRDLNHSQG